MATSPTSRLALLRPLAGHGYSRTEYYNNLGIIDQFPGVFICTSSTRPTWGSAHEGMEIWETDRNLRWRWNGIAFVRSAPLGLLSDPTELSADEDTAATTPVSVLANPVVVPATNAGSTRKRIEVTATWHSIVNGTDTDLGACEVSLLRGSTVIAIQRLYGRPDTAADLRDWGKGGTIVGYDNPAAGAQTYHLAINSIASIGGTTVLEATATTKATLSVKEVGL